MSNINEILIALKEEANSLGIIYSKNIKAPALANKINKAKEKTKVKGLSQEELEDLDFRERAARAARIMQRGGGQAVLDSTKTAGQLKIEHIRKCSNLIRCTVTCLDPVKKDYRGEIIGAGNGKTPCMKKFVPYDGTVTHLPLILYNYIKERTFQQFKTVVTANGKDRRRKSFTLPMFNIVELPHLDTKEMKDLAEAQAARDTI